MYSNVFPCISFHITGSLWLFAFATFQPDLQPASIFLSVYLTDVRLTVLCVYELLSWLFCFHDCACVHTHVSISVGGPSFPSHHSLAQLPECCIYQDLLGAGGDRMSDMTQIGQPLFSELQGVAPICSFSSRLFLSLSLSWFWHERDFCCFSALQSCNIRFTGCGGNKREQNSAG